MNKAQRLIPFIIATGIILACGLPTLSIPGATGPTLTPAPAYTDTAVPSATITTAPPTETAAPTDTAAPSPSPQPPGTPVAYDKIHLTLPPGLADGTTNSSTTAIEMPYTNPGGGDMPQHLKLILSGYPAQGTLFDPQIMAFPADQYAQYGPLSAQIVSTLREAAYMDGQPLPPGLPAGPFNAHVGSVTFANGHGIRYLTQFDQAPLPVNNNELIYYFHGLTNDGTTYIEALLPVQAPFLPADNKQDTPLPSGGIPFSMDDLGSYFQNISDKLNATPPNGFTPSLDTLDAFLQSISIH